jgi:Mn2+/Fe2+ NRAMP family transporter
MAAIQEISARIGRVTGRGIAANLRAHYPNWLLQIIVALVLVANTINIGADLGAMGDALALLIGGPKLFYVFVFAFLCAGLQVFMDYSKYVGWLKWLTLALLAYFGTVMVVHVPWPEAAKGFFIPTFSYKWEFWTTVVAILGTTISPYLFFWMITAAATLNAAGVTDVQTSAQAAEALKPVAGELAFAIFALGIIGTGLLAVPVLAGSAAYALGESRNWPVGLARKPLKAKAFYGAIVAATLFGLVISFSPLDPIKALYWSAVLNGLVAVPVMVTMMFMASNKNIMGRFQITGYLRYVGWAATIVMAAAACIMLVSGFL